MRKPRVPEGAGAWRLTSRLTWQVLTKPDKARLSALALGGHAVQRPQLASHVPRPRKDAPWQVP